MHTKGNWNTLPNVAQIQSDQFEAFVTTDERHIVTCHGETAEEARANANLTAEAPKMLMALEWCLEELYAAEMRAVGPENAFNRQLLNGLQKKVREVVSRAKGVV